MNIEQVARVAHETNRAYCESIGDHSQTSYEQAPQWQRQSAIAGVQFHVGFLRRGVIPGPSASHESWMAQKKADGWSFGPVKDPEKKQHPCFVPYADLPVEQRMKDYLFGAVVMAFWDGDTIEKGDTNGERETTSTPTVGG